MNYRLAKLIYLILTATFVAGLGLSSQGLGPSHATASPQASADESCCQTDGSVPSETTNASCDPDCCPEQAPDQECPCSCPCSCCKVMVRTVNLFSAEVPLTLLFKTSPQRLRPMPHSLPASAALSVAIQPPIV